jgi:GTP cyclohydrolase II
MPAPINPPDAPDSNPALVAVDRAVGEIRRGLPVVLTGAGGPFLALATEYASAEGVDVLARLAGARPAIAVTARRVEVLKLSPKGEDPVLIALSAHFDPEIIRSLADPTGDLTNPLRGPLRRDARRPGAADAAAVRIAKLAQLLPSALVVPVAAGEAPAWDGAADPDGAAWAREHGLLSVAVADVEGYMDDAAGGLVIVGDARVPLADAENTRIYAFRPRDGGIEHLAIVIGDPARSAPVLARLHSECFTGDLLGSLRCDCGEQLRGAIRAIAEAGGGVLLYLAQEGRGIGLVNKLRAYRLQDQGFDTVEANERLGFEPDERVFAAAARMLSLLGFSEVRLMTNNPQKVAGLEHFGVTVVERVPHAFPANDHNAFYLQTKATRSGHLL